MSAPEPLEASSRSRSGASSTRITHDGAEREGYDAVRRAVRVAGSTGSLHP
jgi:hypothetical protein